MRLPQTILKREDFSEVEGSWLERLFRPLNTQFRALASILNNGISLADNIAGFVKTLDVTAPTSVASAQVVAVYATSSGQSIANATAYVTANYDSRVVDTDAAVSTGASWKFTVPQGKGGSYLVSASAAISGIPNATAFDATISILVNGSEVYGGSRLGGTQGTIVAPIAPTVSGSVPVNAGDAISIGVYQNSGAARTLEAVAQHNRVSILGPPSSPSATRTLGNPFPLKIRNTLAGNARPSGVIVLQALDTTGNASTPATLGPVAWSLSGDQILVTDVAGLSAGRRYRLTLLVLA